jgi:hypothetical protein
MDSFFEAYPESARGSQRVYEGSNVLVLHQRKWSENRCCTSGNGQKTGVTLKNATSIGNIQMYTAYAAGS